MTGSIHRQVRNKNFLTMGYDFCVPGVYENDGSLYVHVQPRSKIIYLRNFRTYSNFRVFGLRLIFGTEFVGFLDREIFEFWRFSKGLL